MRPAAPLRRGLAFAALVAGATGCPYLIGAEGSHQLFPADASDGQSSADTPPAAGSYRAEVLKDAPLAYWRLDESAGPTAQDAVGSSPGKYQGGVALGVPGAIKTDPADKAVHFDGASGQIVIGDAFGFEGTSPFSIELWAKVDDYTAGAGFGRIASKMTADLSDGYVLYVDGVGTKLALTRAEQANNELVQADMIGKTTGWHHVVGVYDPAGGQLVLYVDAAPADTDPGTTRRVGSTASVPLVFGSSSESTNFFLGAIDEIAFYTHPLTPERIHAHYQAAIGP